MEGSSSGVQFRLLGPLEVIRAGRHVTPRAPRERSLLALLLTAPGRVFSTEEIIDALWGDDPPRGAAQSIQVYMSRLRRSLGNPSLIVTRAPGYLVAAAAAEVDVARFESAAAQAREALRGGRPQQAATMLHTALGWWRGEALADVTAPFAEPERTRLTELRLGALADRIEADLAVGGGAELVAELEGLTARHPLRERFWAQLMMALYRAGRQGEALGAYRRVRELLVEQLGIEPGPELREMEGMVLAQDDRLTTVASTGAGIPAALRRGDAVLVGRELELAWLVAEFERARAGSRVWAAVEGPAGSGRTRLMAELAGYAHARAVFVTYCSGAGLAEIWPTDRQRPAVVILDDVDQCPDGELQQLADRATVAPGRALVVATYETGRLSPAAAEVLRRVGAQTRMLPLLEAQHVAQIARLYVDETELTQVAAAVLAAGALPHQAHQIAAEWAERQATAAIKSATNAIPGPRQGLDGARGQLIDGLVSLGHIRHQRRSQTHPADDGTIVCPYKGLAFFDTADADYFFGRQRLVAELVARLVEGQLLAVVGASGSGKSSLVRAGLLAALRAGALPGSAAWTYQVGTPHDDLARSDGSPTLLVIDQFEEAFTAVDQNDRDALMHTVLRQVRPGTGRCVLVLRADYLGHLAAYPALAKLASANMVLVAAMSTDELGEAIVGPAERVGLQLDDGLTDTLVAEVANEPGSLPLLSTALLGLWQRRDGRRLTAHAHLQAGGVHAAIARLAESAYARLDPPQQMIARRLLLRLADTAPTGGYVRRRTPIGQLAADTGARAVLDVLATARLISIFEDHAEVAHEALLHHWPRLKAWLDEDEIGRQIRAHLSPAATDWVTHGHDPAELYRGTRLEATLAWAGDHDTELSPHEQQFLDASSAAAAAETLRRRRSIRRLRLLAAGMAVLLAVAGTAGGVAAVQQKRANTAALAADVRALRAQAAATDRFDLALLYAAQAHRFDPSHQTWATLLATHQRSPEAIGIIRVDARPQRLAISPDGARLAIGDRAGNVHLWDTATRRHLMSFRATTSPRHVRSIDFSPDGQRLAVVGAPDPVEDAGSNISVTDLHAEHPQPVYLPKTWTGEAVFTADGTTLVAPTLQRLLTQLDARTGTVVRTYGDGTGIVAPLEVSPSRRYLGVGTFNAQGPIAILDLTTNRSIWSATSGPVIVAPSPDGTHAVLGHANGSVEVLDLTTGAHHNTTTTHTDHVLDVEWSADGTAFATTSDDRTTIVWNRDSLTPQATLAGHRASVMDARFSPDGRTLYTASHDNSIIIWDLDGSRRLGRPVGRPSSIQNPDLRVISRNGNTAATMALVGGPGLEVTDLTGTGQFVLTGPQFTQPYDLSIDAQGQRIAVLAVDEKNRTGSARVLDVPDRRLLPLDVPVNAAAADGKSHAALAISPDGQTLTVADGSGTFQQWNIDTQTRTTEMRPDLRGITTVIAVEPRNHLIASIVIDPQDRKTETLEVADGNTGQHRATLDRIYPNAYWSLQFSPDGHLLAAGTQTGEILLWDTRTWQRLHRWQAYDGFTTSVSFTPDSRYVISGGTDGKAGLWQVKDPTKGPAPIDAAGSGGNWIHVGTNNDGTELITVPQFGTPTRWHINADHLVQRACNIVRRNLTHDEWNTLLPNRPYEQTCPTTT